MGVASHEIRISPSPQVPCGGYEILMGGARGLMDTIPTMSDICVTVKPNLTVTV